MDRSVPRIMLPPAESPAKIIWEGEMGWWGEDLGGLRR